MADRHPRNVMDQRCEKGQGLERRSWRGCVEVRQVVVEPGTVESAVRFAGQVARAGPGGIDRCPVDVLRRRLEPDPDGHPAVITVSAKVPVVPGAPVCWSAAVIRRPVVTAPSDADETSAAYLAMTPPV